MDDDIAEEVYDAEIIETDINELCRICGSTSDSPLVPIYEESGLVEELASKIMLYLPIKISEDDALPVKVCVNCANGVLTWHLLFECCVDADRRFQAMLSEVHEIRPESRKKSIGGGNMHTTDKTLDQSMKEDELNERNQAEEHEMEDVMFLRAEFGPEDEQYLEDETHLADEELDMKNEDQSPVKEESILACTVCSQDIEIHEEELDQFLENNQSYGDIRCKNCELLTAGPPSSRKCEICLEILPTRTEMVLHRSQHEKVDCTVCYKKFKNYASMSAHRRLHDSTITAHTCPMCDYSSHRRYNTQVHIKSHVLDFACRICCNCYNSEHLLENHKASHSKLELSTYSTNQATVLCIDCGMNFNSKFQLYFHTIKEHYSDGERFTCSQCDRMFESMTILRKHEETHKEESYKCEECDKTFAKLKYYKEHQNAHGDTRPFQCDICQQRFKYSSNLSQHRGTHLGVKNFKCQYCDKTFGRSNTLKYHLKSHRNQRSYACQFCDSTFVQSSTLSKHIRSLHRKCDKCGEVVGDRKQCQIHLWKDCGK